MLCVWGIGVDGRKVFLALSTTNSASDGSGLEVRRDLLKRGLQTPVTLTTDGASGRIKAIDAMWPRALRIRCWVPTRQHLMQTVPPPAWRAFKALGADLRDAPTFEEGQRRLPGLLAQSQATVPAACRGLADDAEASRNPLKVPPRPRQ